MKRNKSQNTKQIQVTLVLIAFIAVAAFALTNNTKEVAETEELAETQESPEEVQMASAVTDKQPEAPKDTPAPKQAKKIVTAPEVEKVPIVLPNITAKRVDERQWTKKYKTSWNTYILERDMPLETLRNFDHTIGPLGIRCLMHDNVWIFNWPFFNKAVPAIMKDSHQELAMNCYEVNSVYEGSPSEGKLQKGDIIYEVNGERLISAAKYWKEDYTVKNIRGVNPHMGDLIDQSEGRANGKMTMKIIRTSEMSSADLAKLHFATPPIKVIHESVLAESDRITIPMTGKAGKLSLTFKNDTRDVVAAEILDLSGFYLTNGEFVAHYDARHDRPDSKISSTRRESEPAKMYRKHHVKELTMVLNIPAGTKEFVLALSNRRDYNQADLDLKFEYQPAGDFTKLPASLTPFIKDITLNLPTWGTFGANFPDDCPKTEGIARLNADFLAVNQDADGSWKRGFGYCGRHFDTSMAALALLSMDDPKYDEPIKKAADFIAFHCTYDYWTLPKAQCLLFLSEYYLRYKDDRVLPAMQNIYDNLTLQVMADNTAGHGGRSPAYDGGGMNLGTSNLVLAMAAASKTPIKCDSEKIHEIFNQLSRIAPNGGVPYGRALTKATNKITRGYSGARTGPALLGAIIFGGNQEFIKNATKHTNDNLGSGDVAHAVSSMAMVWTSLSLANADEEAFRKHMAIFKWKLTMDRTFDNGGYIQNPFPCDHQAGETVVGVWWRTAAIVLSLNANKKNMAITGAPQYKAKRFNQERVSDANGSYKHESFLDRCVIVEQHLGSNAPRSLKALRAELSRLKDNRELAAEVERLIVEELPTVLKDISLLKLKTFYHNASAIEILAGVEHTLTMQRQNDGSMKLTWAPPSINENFQVSGKELKISEPMLKIPDNNASRKFFTFDKSKLTHTLKNTKAIKTRFPLQVTYEINGIKISYVRYFKWDKNEAMNIVRNSIPVEGKIIRQPSGIEVYFSTINGHKVEALSPDKLNTLIIGDKTHKLSVREFWPVITGASCVFDYHPRSPGYARVFSIKVLKNPTKALAIESVTSSSPRVVNKGNLKNLLADANLSTGVELKKVTTADDRKPVVFYYTLKKAQKMNHISFILDPLSREHVFKCEVKKAGKWVLVAEGLVETRPVPVTTSKEYRITLRDLKDHPCNVRELKLYYSKE